jgi:hypothetical protein
MIKAEKYYFTKLLKFWNSGAFKNKLLKIVVLSCLMLTLSCATKPSEYKEIDDAVGFSDFHGGIGAIIRAQERNRPVYRVNNAISLFLDKGLLEHYAGNYADSSQSLQEAERLIDEAYTKSVSAEVMSYIANDNTKDYPGEDFEDIYLNVFNALNYYHNGSLDGAMVEVRKLTLPSGKLDMLGRKYEKTEEKAKAQLKGNQSAPSSTPINYSNSALARYLSVLFYLADGNAAGARIESAGLQDAFSANPNIYSNPIPHSVADAQNVPRELARLNVIAFTGLPPIKKEKIIRQPLIFFQNMPLQFAQFKLPALVKRPSDISRIEVVAGDDIFYLELLEDMGAVMEETFRARYNNIFLKTYIRTIIKYTAADIAATEIGRQKGATFALLSAGAAKIAIDATEGADIRMSRFLPDKAYIGGVNLAPGIYNVKVNFYQGDKLLSSIEYDDFALDEKGLNLIEAINLK